VCSLGRSANEIVQRLGLCEVHSAVQEGAQAEFTRLGQARSSRQDRPKNPAWRLATAVTMQLDHVLTAEAARTGHQHGEDLVDSTSASLFDNPAVDQTSGPHAAATSGAKHSLENFTATLPANPYYRQAGLTWRGGDGGDGIGVHSDWLSAAGCSGPLGRFVQRPELLLFR
jgi:hypothetical protein